MEATDSSSADSEALEGHVEGPEPPVASQYSEVDACNQAQYLMPVNSKVDRFSVSSSRGLGGTNFNCRVYWSYKSNLYYPANKPEEQPILLPWDVPEPSPIGIGWF